MNDFILIPSEFTHCFNLEFWWKSNGNCARMRGDDILSIVRLHVYTFTDDSRHNEYLKIRNCVYEEMIDLWADAEPTLFSVNRHIHTHTHARNRYRCRKHFRFYLSASISFVFISMVNLSGGSFLLKFSRKSIQLQIDSRFFCFFWFSVGECRDKWNSRYIWLSPGGNVKLIFLKIPTKKKQKRCVWVLYELLRNISFNCVLRLVRHPAAWTSWMMTSLAWLQYLPAQVPRLQPINCQNTSNENSAGCGFQK